MKGKTVVIGICGGIAAYKTIEVVSRLKKLGAEVHVILTEHALNFVTPLTLQTISQNPVIKDMFDQPENWDIKHVSLAEKADLILIAPATANIIGKIAGGIADDMLTTTVMASKAPVLVVPAMNSAMYENTIVQGNILKLREIGYVFMEPETGMLACGSKGRGRLPEPASIVEEAKSILVYRKDMQGLKVLVTAGPTREPLDPVRYITNNSSGKMGYAFAENAHKRGAKVRLISGPVGLARPCGIEVVSVNTALEMYDAVMGCFRDFDIIIMMAAVADYRSSRFSDEKIKKSGDEIQLELVKNPDIAKELGKVKGGRILIGACAETGDLIRNARSKLSAKNFDIIMANDITKEGAGFGADTNIVAVLKKDGDITELPMMSKKDIAGHVLDEALKMSGHGHKAH